MEFGSIDKLKIIFGVAKPEPTVFVAEPANEPGSEKKPKTPLPCFKLSPYWKSLLGFWEGYKPYRYKDGQGFWTVGVGTLIDPRRVSEAELRRKLGSYYTAVMDGIQRDRRTGKKVGLAPLRGTRQAPISVDVAWQWAERDVQIALQKAINAIGADAWGRLSYPVQCVIVSLAYQTGGNLSVREEWGPWREALRKIPPDYVAAARTMGQVQYWLNVTQPDRKNEMIKIVKSGGAYIPTSISGFTASNPETARTNPCGSTPASPSGPTSPQPLPNWPVEFHETMIL